MAYTPSTISPTNPNGDPLTASGVGATDPSTLQRVLDIIGSKGGQTIAGAAGAGLQAYGQAQQLSQNKQLAAAQLKQQADQFAATQAFNSLNADRNFTQGQAQAGLNASPLGANQNFAQKQALAQVLLGGARNVSYTPGDPAVAAAMGTHSGGMQLPANGLDPAMLERLFGANATQNSIAQHEKQIGQVNPNNPAYDMGSLFGNSADGSENSFTTGIRANNNTALDAQNTQDARQHQIIQNAIDDQTSNANSLQQQQGSSDSGSGIWSKLAKIGLIAGGGIATAMTAGAASPLLGLAIGAGTGAASGALNGGGLKGALIGGALGGVTGGIGSGASGAASQGIGSALKSTLTNPGTLAGMAGAGIGGNAGNMISTYAPLATNYLLAKKNTNTPLGGK